MTKGVRLNIVSKKFEEYCNRKNSICGMNSRCTACIKKWMDRNCIIKSTGISKYCKDCIYMAKTKTYCSRWGIKQTGNKRYCRYRKLQ